MDRALSLLISAGIAAFGVWITGYTLASGSPPGWTLMGILSIMVGSISLYQAIGEARLAR
jgi:xanthosine utilization system XapX-like protein